MSVSQAFLAGVALAALVIVLAVLTTLLTRHLEMRRLAKRWKAAHEASAGKVTVLPSGCTCCPEHGPQAEPAVEPSQHPTSPSPGSNP